MKKIGIFCFDISDHIYDEHFPGNPVVPGSVIVSAFLRAGEESGFCAGLVRDFRFKGFVAPGEHAFSIEYAGDQMKCRLFQGNTDTTKILVTGTIER